MKEKLIAAWNGLTTKNRRLLVLGGLAIGMSAIGFLGWAQATKKPVGAQKKVEAVKEVKVGGDLLGKSQVLESQAETAKLKQQIEDMRTGKVPINQLTPAQQAEAMATPGKLTPTTPGQLAPTVAPNGQVVGADGKPVMVNGKPMMATPGQQIVLGPNGQPMPVTPAAGQTLPGVAANLQQTTPGQPSGKRQKRGPNAGMNDLPPLPTLPPPSPSGMPQQAGGGVRGGAPRGDDTAGAVEYGDIAIVTNSTSGKTTAASSDKEDKKKGNRTIYLPAGSFMEATLLSGLDAPVTEGAKSHPVPVLLRVKMPAVLPNDIKASLTRGCFVIADGKGNLGTERAELTLVSMSCMDRKGNAVIDQKIKGWIVDEDGRAGLRGIPTAKFGSMIARSMLAGFLGGMGKAFENQSKTSTVSPLTGVQTLTQTGEQALVQGIGSGISSAFGDTQKFYMDLAKSMLPVISVGSTKIATLIIAEGVSLEIKKSIR